MNTPRHQARLPKAFTILEMLMAISIILVAMAVAIPSFRSIVEGRRLDTAADQLLSALQLARQQAITQNRDVEIRFYTFAKDGTHQTRAMQTFLIQPNGAKTALSEWFPLPQGIIFSQATSESSLASLPTTSPTDHDRALPPPAERNYTYRPLLLQRNGRPALIPQPFYLTLQREGRSAPGRTIRLDAATGRVGLIQH